MRYPGIRRGERPRSPRDAGFTLIEILVVVVILAVLAAAVTIAMAGSGGERQLEREAERLQALLGYACEHAEIGGRAVGLSLVDGGFVFSQQDGENWKPFVQGELRDRQWPANLRAELSRDGRRIEIPPQPPEVPPVICFASGELTPFRLELGLPDLGLRWRLDGSIAGDVKRERRDVSR
ncbi:type II secretion system minor pseudopilin GspH [Tahibacter caeni]|uniref:type II secretion system minor pseudopilin GspH n=1 Tax=Tahibacter caeni TaxID=1453545 RepID=UPI0021472C02